MSNHDDSSGDPRIALITGGNRGLGRSEALALAETGVDVIITYRSGAQQAEAVVAEVQDRGRRATALQLDVTAYDHFAAFADDVRGALAQHWERDTFDILVNNAGEAAWTPVGETELSEVQRMLGQHVTAVVMLTQALLPLLADGGRILNTSTGLARFIGDPGYSVYAAAKGAVEVYTRYLAKALGPRGIAVNAIAPGATATDFGGGRVRDDDQVQQALAGLTAMGRVGRPDDIGAAVAAVLAPGTGWITGQRIEASGGQQL